MWRNTSQGYGAISKLFHWVIFVLLFCMIVFGYFLEDVPEDYQGLAYNVHKLTGLTILVLMILRLFWTITNPKPELPVATTLWQRVAERLVHWSLYVAVIGMPLAGWIGSVAAEHPPHLGSWIIGLPIAPSKSLADNAFDVHGYLAIAIIVLVGIHVAAALYHHFVRKDDVLRRMLPCSQCCH